MSDVIELLSAAFPEAAVVGLEGFHADGADLVPDLDFIADLSTVAPDAAWRTRVDACADAALRLLERWAAEDRDLLVQFVCVGPR